MCARGGAPPGRRAPTETKRATFSSNESRRRTKPFAIVARRSFERRMDGRCFRHRLSTRSRSRSTPPPTRRRFDASRRRFPARTKPKTFWKPKTRSKRNASRGHWRCSSVSSRKRPETRYGPTRRIREPRPALCSGQEPSAFRTRLRSTSPTRTTRRSSSPPRRSARALCSTKEKRPLAILTRAIHSRISPRRAHECSRRSSRRRA